MFQPVFHSRAFHSESELKIFNCPIKSNYNSTKLFSIIFKSNLSVYILCSAKSNPHRRLKLLLHSSSFRPLDKQKLKRILFKLVSFRHKYQIWFLCWWYLMRLKGKESRASDYRHWKTFNYDIMKHLSPNGVYITFEILIKNKQRRNFRPRFQLIKRLFIRQWIRVSQSCVVLNWFLFNFAKISVIVYCKKLKHKFHFKLVFNLKKITTWKGFETLQ